MDEMTPPSVQPMSKSRRVLAWVIALVLVVLIGTVTWFYLPREKSQEIAPGQLLVSPKDGALISGFPAALIIDSDAVLSQSYRIEYESGNINLPFAKYSSRKSMAELITAYKNYFASNAWTLTREGSPDELPLTFFYGYKENEEVSVALTPAASGTEVTVTYTRKGEK